MSQRPDDDSADSDPLSLFATEPQSVATPAPQVEIPKEIEPTQTSPELDALVHRAETAERSLREAKRDAAELKRQVATLVSAAKDNHAQGRRSALTLGLAAAGLLALVSIGWRFIPAAVPPSVAAAEPASGPEVQPEVESPVPVAKAQAALVLPDTPAGLSSPRSLPRRDAPARAQQRIEPEPQEQFVGTLSVDAVPAGGEVFINRKSVGPTPVRLSGLRAGSHLVWIERAGYRRFTRVVTVPADKVSRVSVALEPENSSVVRP